MRGYLVQVVMLDSEGNWGDSSAIRFPIIPVAGDFIVMSFTAWEVIKRSIYTGDGLDDVISAEITVKVVL